MCRYHACSSKDVSGISHWDFSRNISEWRHFAPEVPNATNAGAELHGFHATKTDCLLLLYKMIQRGHQEQVCVIHTMCVETRRQETAHLQCTKTSPCPNTHKLKWEREDTQEMSGVMETTNGPSLPGCIAVFSFQVQMFLWLPSQTHNHTIFSLHSIITLIVPKVLKGSKQKAFVHQPDSSHCAHACLAFELCFSNPK